MKGTRAKDNYENKNCSDGLTVLKEEERLKSDNDQLKEYHESKASCRAAYNDIISCAEFSPRTRSEV